MAERIPTNKVLRHPEREEIIKRLLQGESVRDVETWLKKKYKDKKRLQISSLTLQKFRKEHLNLKGELLEDIMEAKKNISKKSLDAEVKSIISKSTHYQQAVNEIASKELDATNRLLEMDALVKMRLEELFNTLQEGHGSLKHDKIFIEYLKEYRAILQDWKKYIEGFADKKVEHNISITMFNDQLNIFKNIIFAILKELDPSLVPLFVEKVNQQLGLIEVGNEDYKRLQVIDADEFED